MEWKEKLEELKEYENKLKDIEKGLILIYGKDIDDLMQDMKEIEKEKEEVEEEFNILSFDEIIEEIK